MQWQGRQEYTRKYDVNCHKSLPNLHLTGIQHTTTTNPIFKTSELPSSSFLCQALTLNEPKKLKFLNLSMVFWVVAYQKLSEHFCDKPRLLMENISKNPNLNTSKIQKKIDELAMVLIANWWSSAQLHGLQTLLNSTKRHCDKPCKSTPWIIILGKTLRLVFAIC